MLQWFRKKSQGAPDFVPHTGGRTVYAVGDVHGRLDLLDLLLGMIKADAERRSPAAPPLLIMLGDYVDRGPDSRGVLERMIKLASAPDFETTALMGNHERAMLNFLRDPAAHKAWLSYGGRETIQSYGVTPVASNAHDDELIDCAAKLESQVAPHLDFLRGLKLSHVVGNYAFVHAGVRPGVGLEEQAEHDLLWIRAPFLTRDRHGLPYRVVHGHTPEPIVRIGVDRIGLDTGAYASGILSAARITDAEVDVLDTTP